MTTTDTTTTHPAPGTFFRIRGERGVYRAHEPSKDGGGLWCYGGTTLGQARLFQWRCVAWDRIGKTVRTSPGHGVK